jgi:hypothetical protein
MRVFHCLASLPIVPLVALALFPGIGWAEHISGAGPLGRFDGSMTWTPLDPEGGRLAVVLTNTSPADNGGYLTAFALNNPADLIHGVGLDWPRPDNFGVLVTELGFRNGVNAAPFGRFDFGATITDGSFEGWGNPRRGLAAGETAIFYFTLRGLGVGSLTQDDFFAELSEGPGADRGHQFFVARFRGFVDGGSDKVPAQEPQPGRPPKPRPVVHQPEPGTLTLCGLGVLGLLGYRFWPRKRRPVTA